MNVVLTLVSISALALCLLIWLLSRLRDRKGTGAEAKPQAEQSAEPARVGQQELSNQELPAQEQKAPEAKKDVNFRIQGERGMGGPLWRCDVRRWRLSAPCLGVGHSYLV